MAKQVEIVPPRPEMNVDTIYAEAAVIGKSAVSDQTVFDRFFKFEYETAVKVRTEKLNVVIDKKTLFTSFDTPFRAASSGYREPLKASSIETWASAFGAAWDAGMFAEYDMTSYLSDVLALEGKISYTVRGSKLRKLMAEYPKTAPTAEQWAAILTPDPKAKGDVVLAYAKARVAGANDTALKRNEGELIKALRDDPRKAAAFKAYRDACVAFEKAVSSSGSALDALLADATQAATNGAQPNA